MFAAWLLATRRGSRKLAWSLAALAALGLTSCSGLPRAGTPKGAFTITVTATSGALTHSSTTTLNVN
jgi:NADPH-dependent curcumin reductase CurA